LKTRERYDLVVVGAGSGGFAAARTARDLGASVALIDHGPLGGLCILRGCMPSKTLLASSDAIADMRAAVELGIAAGDITIDLPHIMRRKAELIRGFADYRIEGLRQFPLYEGPARFLSSREVEAAGAVLEAGKFIIATGSVVAPAAVQGLSETGFIDSDAALELQTLPRSLVVLGGGYVACELGQFFARMGVKTSIVLRSPHLLSGEDHDVGEGLTEYFRGEGIDVHTATQIVRASKRDAKKIAHVVHGGVEGEIEADELLYCLGRVPNFEGLNLEAAGVPCHNITGIETDETMRTCNPDFYAIGDVAGKHMLVHVAIYEGEVAARNALRKAKDAPEKADYTITAAHTVFSDPQVAVVGKTERELQAKGVAYVKGAYDFAEHGKAQCIGKTKGFVKILAAADGGKILGAAILGPHGSDLIHEMIVAMRYDATVAQFMCIPHLHPTLAEIWTYPAEECAAKLNMAGPGQIDPEIAL
jgi:pyruvate/2-oxoglutarate dehydrogenase complex dihydrolipoamide dehydrogenase (E3) component